MLVKKLCNINLAVRYLASGQVHNSGMRPSKVFSAKRQNMVQRPESPNLLRSVGSSCYILLHVDDMLMCGKADSVDNRLFLC